MTYLESVLFIHDETFQYDASLQENEFGTFITQVDISDFLKDPQSYKVYAKHIIISCSNENLHYILQEAVKYNYSLSFLPDTKQKELINLYRLTTDYKANLEIALRDDLKSVDLIECNGEYYHHGIRLGQSSLIQIKDSEKNILQKAITGISYFHKLKLFSCDITTGHDRVIKTAASNIIITNHVGKKSFTSLLFPNASMRDGKMSMIIVSPYSIKEYFLFFISILKFSNTNKNLSSAVAYLQSNRFEISADNVPVELDGVKNIETPIVCEVKKSVLSINASEEFWENNLDVTNEKEVVQIANLPDEKERVKYTQKRLPFFAVASTERFKELFSILRDDAKSNSKYVTLMFLSTIIAAIGLFANSAAVVIGAMVLAPLMTPIVALAMGLLRGETEMLQNSLFKIFIGIIVAISASVLLSIIVPHVGLTGELKARINPTLLDLGVAIFSGIAAAYSKAHKSIRESLAGVAIAVALVPPLATAGIGLGRGEFYVFYGAFLLFFTNLIGITLAATITFQFLGFSNAVKSKKSLLSVGILLVIISYPLYLSFVDILQKHRFNARLANNRFLVEDKYIIVERAVIVHKDDVDLVRLKILVRESLNRKEFLMLKNKIQKRSKKTIHLSVETEYIL